MPWHAQSSGAIHRAGKLQTPPEGICILHKVNPSPSCCLERVSVCTAQHVYCKLLPLKARRRQRCCKPACIKLWSAEMASKIVSTVQTIHGSTVQNMHGLPELPKDLKELVQVMQHSAGSVLLSGASFRYFPADGAHTQQQASPTTDDQHAVQPEQHRTS